MRSASSKLRTIACLGLAFLGLVAFGGARWLAPSVEGAASREREFGQGGRAEMVGTTIEARPRQTLSLTELVRLTATGQAEENLPWLEAKPYFRVDFLIDDSDRELFDRWALSINVSEFGFGEDDGPVYLPELGELPEWDWNKWLACLGGRAPFPSFSSMEALCDEYSGTLQDGASDLARLYAESLLEYYEHEMFIRVQKGQRAHIPEGYYGEVRSRFNCSFASSGHGWELQVSFDAADFPRFMNAIAGVRAVKKQFLDEVRKCL